MTGYARCGSIRERSDANGVRGMGNRPVDRLIGELEMSFGAAAAREEEAAATDLAVSLMQDRTLIEAALRAGPLTLTNAGGSLPVRALGPDFVLAGEGTSVLVPSAKAVLTASPGPTPRHTDRSFVEALRVLARLRCEIELRTGDAHYVGRITLAGRDHVVMEGRTGRVMAGLGAVDFVRLISRDSADDL